MRVALGALFFLSTPAFADVIAAPCDGLEEGAACLTDAGADGTCDAEGECVVSAEEPGGCSTVGPSAAAAGLVAGSIGLLVVGRGREL